MPRGRPRIGLAPQEVHYPRSNGLRVAANLSGDFGQGHPLPREVLGGGSRGQPMTQRDSALRASDALNRFIGTLHAARCTMVIWIPEASNPKWSRAAKFSLQMTFGAVALTLRKFEDFWSEDIPRLISEKTERPDDGLKLVRESKRRHLRHAANNLIAHYKDKGKRILSPTDILALVNKGGWETEEELMAWIGEVAIARLIAVRDALMRRYDIKELPRE